VSFGLNVAFFPLLFLRILTRRNFSTRPSPPASLPVPARSSPCDAKKEGPPCLSLSPSSSSRTPSSKDGTRPRLLSLGRGLAGVSTPGNRVLICSPSHKEDSCCLELCRILAGYWYQIGQRHG